MGRLQVAVTRTPGASEDLAFEIGVFFREFLEAFSGKMAAAVLPEEAAAAVAAAGIDQPHGSWVRKR